MANPRTLIFSGARYFAATCHMCHTPLAHAGRARKRVKLGGAAREYNACGEVDDFDFVNAQARGQASCWWD